MGTPALVMNACNLVSSFGMDDSSPILARDPITNLLRKFAQGDRYAEDQLFEAVHGELKRLARAALSGERRNHSLNPTALVNEAFLRLPRDDFAWQNRSHFYSVCARAMRRILVDHARRNAACKRPDPRQRVQFDQAVFIAKAYDCPEDLLAIDTALEKLGRTDPKLAELVELRFFGGMTEEEIADLHECSSRTVKRDWQLARLWLYKQLKRDGSGETSH
jgi:RNA polymerase sigma-70 factor, ECF subfamily